MPSRSQVLREVMRETGTTQSELSRISGVRQPSISQFLSGRTPMSDDMLDRLLSCMGYSLEILRRPVKPGLGVLPVRMRRRDSTGEPDPTRQTTQACSTSSRRSSTASAGSR